MVGDYHRYFEELPCYVSVQDIGLCIIDANHRFREDFGERCGDRCYSVYKGRTEVCDPCPVKSTFADGQSHASEQVLTTRSGEAVPVMVHTTPILGEDGTIVAVLEMHTDISEMRRVEDRLKRSRERLTGLFEEVPCYLSVQGRDLVIQHANRAFRETFGDAVGEHCYQVYKHRDEPCLVCPALQAFDDGESREHEEVVTSSSGRKINVLSTTAPIRGADGEVTSVIEMSTDITQLRQLQSQLESIGLLVGSISHGIKGLLTGLDGGMYLVNTGFAKEDTARVEKGWEMVQRNVARIRSMVQDILYYAKDRDLEVVGVDATVLGRDIAQILEKKARDFDVTLEVQIADDLGIFEGDAQAFRATLLNLLENSLEACRSDRNKTGHHVRFSVWRDEPWMCFEIEDDGVGMDRETKDKIFSLFFTSKGIRGTGLGLFIANKIVEKHGGTIDVRSEPGHGSRFRVRVPLEARPSTRPPEVSQAGDEN